MSGEFSAFLFGLLLGFSMSIAFDLVSGRITMYKEYKSAIEQCEKELPRNQKCKIIAVVETKDVR